MDNEETRTIEVLLGSAAGSGTYVEESARGASAVQFVPEPTMGPAGGSGASDSAGSAKSE